ncbi:hypothetical protein M3Y95_01209500 [Aphelenchoides besseyi]|nr:hypothetical protein M3Y95_01209500 [Aphelenchoides besseyi]
MSEDDYYKKWTFCDDVHSAYDDCFLQINAYDYALFAWTTFWIVVLITLSSMTLTLLSGVCSGCVRLGKCGEGDNPKEPPKSDEPSKPSEPTVVVESSKE